jgi:hypothetical protein
MEEIEAERLRVDHRGEVAVRGGDDANVDRNRTIGADRRDRPLIEHAQQLGLRGERPLSDLVEEDRTAAGLQERAVPVVDRAGECADAMAADR